MAIVPATSIAAVSDCDLHVVVREYDGNLTRKVVPVVAVGDENRIIAETTTKNGAAELCDVGIKPFTIRVGGECGQVLVRNVQISERPLTIPVFYEDCHGFRARDGCQILVRVRNTADTPVAGAEVGTAGVPRVRTDRYGRAEFAVRYPDTSKLMFDVSAAGYAAAQAEARCVRDDPDVEVSIKLVRAQ